MNLAEINLNQEVIIYPTEQGWIDLFNTLKKNTWVHVFIDDNNTEEDVVNEYIDKKRTDDGGYKDQLWQIIHDYGSLFYNGSDFLKTSVIKILPL